MAQYDSGAAALVKKSHNLVAPSLELSVNKTTILEGKHQKNTGCFLVIILTNFCRLDKLNGIKINNMVLNLLLDQSSHP